MEVNVNKENRKTINEVFNQHKNMSMLYFVAADAENQVNPRIKFGLAENQQQAASVFKGVEVSQTRSKGSPRKISQSNRHSQRYLAAASGGKPLTVYYFLFYKARNTDIKLPLYKKKRTGELKKVGEKKQHVERVAETMVKYYLAKKDWINYIPLYNAFAFGEICETSPNYIGAMLKMMMQTPNDEMFRGFRTEGKIELDLMDESINLPRPAFVYRFHEDSYVQITNRKANYEAFDAPFKLKQNVPERFSRSDDEEEYEINVQFENRQRKAAKERKKKHKVVEVWSSDDGVGDSFLQEEANITRTLPLSDDGKQQRRSKKYRRSQQRRQSESIAQAETGGYIQSRKRRKKEGKNPEVFNYRNKDLLGRMIEEERQAELKKARRVKY